MNIQKIKLLAISPSECIQELLYEITSSMDNIEIDSYVANHYQGVEIVRQSAALNYDAILARGETASMIREETTIPVIEFPLSFYDVLQAMKLADNFNEPYAIVGFTPVTNIAHMLRDLMQLDLDIYTLFTLNDAIPTMERIKSKGYKLIVSGMGITSFAKQNGLTSILITTSKDSLVSAIDQAVRLCTSLAQQKKENSFLLTLLQQSNQDILVFNDQKELIFSSLKSLKQDLALSLASKRLQNSHGSDDSVSLKFINDVLITIQKKKIVINNEVYTLFFFSQQKKAYSTPKNELQIFSKKEAADIFLSHYLGFSTEGYVSNQSLEKIIHSSLPVMIFGESGVGKQQIAATLYTQGCYQNNPYIIVDFEFSTEKTWNFLFGNTNSPLNSDGYTIYFRSLESLSPGKIDRLKTLLYNTRMYQRNRIIFSYTTTAALKDNPHIFNLANQLSCLSLHMLSLKERISELKALTSLYISTANATLIKQVAGCTPKAMALLESYQWPGNLEQFSRIIFQLVNGSSSPYIQEEFVKRVLSSEDSKPNVSALSDVLDLNKPLEDIEKDIVHAILVQTNGNQSQAAARLGICRTTLWKILKK